MLKNYRLGFDLWGLILFLITMVPTFVWMAVPPEGDVLSAESVTPTIDAISFILQVLFVAILCFVVRKDGNRKPSAAMTVAIVTSVVLYFAGWLLYYHTDKAPIGVILLLIIPPCLAFILIAIARRNIPALIPAVGFTVCHLIYATANFIIS